ncbi:heterokaryon incompatibility protein [Phlyctema vagabunda]|uniref:Heterokaryon incompatibility protein n=1 Tax=Phlyctema vagabunda TaxID=108571 RepID=A0ABR4P6X5_9HELO
MDEAQPWPMWSPSQLLCSKCQVALLPVQEPELACAQFAPRHLDTFSLHSPSIASLNDSRLLNCHLCVQMWAARHSDFNELLQREEDTTVPVALHFRWESLSRKTLGAKRWKHEPRRLVFATDIDLKPRTSEEWHDHFSHMLIGDEAERLENRLTFYMTSASNSTTDGESPPYDFRWISASTSSPNTHMLANMWITDCLRGHTECTRLQDSRGRWNPTRVLDVESSEVDSGVKLWEPEPNSEAIMYTTLSHSWGTAEVVTMNCSNYESFKAGIPNEAFTKTFKHAIATTRKLGVRYLWVDSLCIKQKCPDDCACSRHKYPIDSHGVEQKPPSDWELEAGRMGDVYKYGYCNIAAVRSKLNAEGLHVKRNPLIITPLMLSISNGDNPTEGVGNYCFHQQFEEWFNLDTAPLNQRAWVFQERVLSPRTLYFGSNQVSYECCGIKASEAWPFSNKRNSLYDRTLKSQLSTLTTSKLDAFDRRFVALDFWKTAVSSYSATDISFDTDRLIAMSGLARSVQRIVNYPYLAGLWMFHLEYQLSWHVTDRGTSRRADPSPAPSWSWASVHGRVKTPYKLWSKENDSEHKVCVTFLNLKDLSLVDNFGQIDSRGNNSIKVQGQLAKGVLGMDLIRKLRVATQLDRPRGTDEYPMLEDADFDTSDVDDAEAYCLLLFTSPALDGLAAVNRLIGRVDLHGLMLFPATGEGRRPGEFTRCGTFQIYHGDASKSLQKAFSVFASRAKESGLPFRKGRSGNEFLVTIV